MFRISAITRVGLVAVACVAVAAPSALAKTTPVKANAKSPYGYAMSYTPTKATRKAAKPATQTAATPSADPWVSENTGNTDYEYYGSPSGS